MTKDRRHPHELVELGGRRATDISNDERLTKLENNQHEFAESLKRIEELLRPIAETYSTASNLMKWMMGGAVFVSIIIGSILGLLKIFSHK